MKNVNPMLPNFLSDIMIKHAPVPVVLDGATARGVLWQAAAGRFLLDLPGVARYLVEGGHTVTIEPCLGGDEAAAEHFLKMTPLAALLYQRGLVVFHAAAVADERGVVLLAGESGAGKSVLLAALLQRGWTMLADDLAVVAPDGQGRLLVQPMYPEISLWPDAVKRLGIDPASLRLCDANRYGCALPERFAGRPLPLRAIYWLNVHQKQDTGLVPLAEKDCFRTVGTFLYNSQIADALMDRAAYLQCVAAIAGSVPTHNLLRPRSAWSADALAGLIDQ